MVPPAVLPFPVEVTNEVLGSLEADADRALGAGGRDLVVDLGRTTFLGSGGFGLLVKLGKRLHDRGGGLALARPQPTVSRLLRTLGLGVVLPHFPAVEDAVGHLRRRGAAGPAGGAS
jgi:anti-anti-sigma factor